MGGSIARDNICLKTALKSEAISQITTTACATATCCAPFVFTCSIARVARGSSKFAAPFTKICAPTRKSRASRSVLAHASNGVSTPPSKLFGARHGFFGECHQTSDVACLGRGSDRHYLLWLDFGLPGDSGELAGRGPEGIDASSGARPGSHQSLD